MQGVALFTNWQKMNKVWAQKLGMTTFGGNPKIEKL